jgi:6-pyruvoyl tetrahydropterin synthase/QueD family protein
MFIRLSKSFSFDSAHWLPTFPQGHKCRRLHGHTFQIEITVAGEVDPAKGYLVDYGDIKRAVSPLIDRLDHQLLNSMEGLANPTAENLCRYIWDAVKPALPMLEVVRVCETCTTAAEYRGG